MVNSLTLTTLPFSTQTLRDGEHTPGAAMTEKEKMDIARQLVKLGVDVIEAGFPAATRAYFDLEKLIAQEIGNVRIMCPPYLKIHNLILFLDLK